MSPPRTLAAPPVDTPTGATTAPPTLWDPVVRLSHWGIALAVVSNAMVNEGGSLAHVAIGWAAMALLLTRLVWGVLGPFEARFSAFPPNPLAALQHLHGIAVGKRMRHYPSHNPAGALMIYAFWGALIVVMASGLVMTGGATPMQVAADKAAVASGDWSALVRDDGADHSENAAFKNAAEEVHIAAANLLLILAALHIAGVLVESRRMQWNLLPPMLLGSKTPPKARPWK